MRLRVEAEVSPTESREKVESAVRQVFPTLLLKLEEGKLVGESGEVSSLDRLHYLLRARRILDAARSAMFAGLEGDASRFSLNKQAAFVGKVAFAGEESPLGPVVVEVQAPDVERLLDYLAPRTKDGKPIEEIGYP